MPETGPHLVVAVFCEKVLQEGDGVISLIRIVDRMTQTATGPDPPDLMPPFIVSDIQMVLSLKPDRAKGRHTIKLFVEDPSGSSIEIGAQDVTLTSGNQGQNVFIPVQFAVQLEGVYWFEVFLGGPRGQKDVLMTRLPLEVVYQRLVVPGSRNPPAE